MFKKVRSIEERFWEKVDVRGPDDCWNWKAATTMQGISKTGKFFINPEKKQAIAYRVSYELHSGQPIPKGLEVMHTCDNRMCVNPAHLRLGTHQDNMTDMKLKGRGRGGISLGEKHGLAKLNARQVRKIYRRTLEGETRERISRDFGVSPRTISSIAVKRTWSHVTNHLD